MIKRWLLNRLFLEEVVEMLNVKNFAAKYIRLQKH